MVSAELTHNPYLRKTSALFNGNPPRINSQIEKYEDKPLIDWVKRVPQIFRDEMNGLDFDLYFTGTVSDYEAVKAAFEGTGISPEEVRIFLKNELESVELKRREIEKLGQWLCETPNRKFDASAFRADHAELFGCQYHCIIVGGDTGFTDASISAESVADAAELEGTVLTYTPIIFAVDDMEQNDFRESLLTVLRRDDVRENQLFFQFAPNSSDEQMERVICDMGVRTPQVICGQDDGKILNYIHNYPMTEHVHTAIGCFRHTIEEIGTVLQDEQEESARTNVSAQAGIGRLDQTAEVLKKIDSLFCENSYIRKVQEFDAAADTLKTQVSSWRNRKAKMIGEQEIAAAAQAYDADLARYFKRFEEDLKRAFCDRIVEVSKRLHAQYLRQDIETAYHAEEIHPEKLEEQLLEPLEQEFLSLKIVTHGAPKNDIIGLLRLDPAKGKEPAEVITCYYEHWRDKAAEHIMPLAAQMVAEAVEVLNRYGEALSAAYHEQLLRLIAQQKAEKDQAVEQLSAEEKRLQQDSDWLRNFSDQLTHIERG